MMFTKYINTEAVFTIAEMKNELIIKFLQR